MATHSSTLTGRMEWMADPGGFQSVGLQRGTEHAHTHPEKVHDCPMYADAG